MMNSAEAAEEGPNDADTEPFFKTGSFIICFCDYGCQWVSFTY